MASLFLGLEALAAAGLVLVRRADDDALAGIRQALAEMRRVAADHADGQVLGDELGHGHQLGHVVEGLAAVVLVQAGHYHAAAGIRQPPGHLDDLGAEEMRLVYAHHLRGGVHQLQDLFSALHGLRGKRGLVVGDYVLARVAHVEVRVEDLHLLLGYGQSGQ